MHAEGQAWGTGTFVGVPISCEQGYPQCDQVWNQQEVETGCSQHSCAQLVAGDALCA